MLRNDQEKSLSHYDSMGIFMIYHILCVGIHFFICDLPVDVGCRLQMCIVVMCCAFLATEIDYFLQMEFIILLVQNIQILDNELNERKHDLSTDDE